MNDKGKVKRSVKKIISKKQPDTKGDVKKKAVNGIKGMEKPNGQNGTGISATLNDLDKQEEATANRQDSDENNISSSQQSSPPSPKSGAIPEPDSGINSAETATVALESTTEILTDSSLRENEELPSGDELSAPEERQTKEPAIPQMDPGRILLIRSNVEPRMVNRSQSRREVDSGLQNSYPRLRISSQSHRSSGMVSVGLRSAPMAVQITEVDERTGTVYARLLNDATPRNRLSPNPMLSSGTYSLRPIYYQPTPTPAMLVVDGGAEWIAYNGTRGGDQHYLNQIGANPTTVICPKCKKKTMTTVVKKPSTCAFLTGGMLCLSGIFLVCSLIPCFHPSCQSVDHYCTWCKNYLGRYSRY